MEEKEVFNEVKEFEKIIKKQYSHLNVSFTELKEMVLKDMMFNTLYFEDAKRNAVSWSEGEVPDEVDTINCIYDNGDDDKLDGYAEVIFRKDGLAMLNGNLFIWKIMD